MKQRKYKRGLCCFHGCQQKATIRLKTPGHCLNENEEQLFCQFHWDQNRKLSLREPDPSRVSRIEPLQGL